MSQDLRWKLAAGNKQLNPSIIAKLKRLTNANNHTEAYILGCEILGLRHTQQKLEAVKQIMALEGSNPISQYTYILYQEMMRGAEQVLAPEAYQAFYACF